MPSEIKVAILEKDGVEFDGPVEHILKAEEVPVNPIPELTATETQTALEELASKGAVAVSPGYTWGDNGNVSNSWLMNDNVPSNRTGRNFSLYNGELTQIAVSNENVNTFDVELWEHDGTTFTLLTTVSVNALRSKVFTAADFGTVNPTQGKELAVKIVNGSCKNPVVACIFKGSSAP